MVGAERRAEYRGDSGMRGMLSGRFKEVQSKALSDIKGRGRRDGGGRAAGPAFQKAVRRRGPPRQGRPRSSIQPSIAQSGGSLGKK